MSESKAGLRPCTSKKTLCTAPFPTSHCSLVSILAPTNCCSGLKPSCQQILRPQQIIEAGWWIQGLCCTVVLLTRAACASLCYRLNRSCVSSHELMWWIGQAYGIHNNILLEEVLHPHGICVFLVAAGKGAWYQSPNTDEARVEDYSEQPYKHKSFIQCLFSCHLYSSLITFTCHISTQKVQESLRLWTLFLWMRGIEVRLANNILWLC